MQQAEQAGEKLNALLSIRKDIRDAFLTASRMAVIVRCWRDQWWRSCAFNRIGMTLLRTGRAPDNSHDPTSVHRIDFLSLFSSEGVHLTSWAIEYCGRERVRQYL